MTKPISRKSQKKAYKILRLGLTVIIVAALPWVLFNLGESTFSPLSLKARDWTGFGGSIIEQATTKKVDGKTLWDWLSVLGVPLTLAFLGAWFRKP